VPRETWCCPKETPGHLSGPHTNLCLTAGGVRKRRVFYHVTWYGCIVFPFVLPVLSILVAIEVFFDKMERTGDGQSIVDSEPVI